MIYGIFSVILFVFILNGFLMGSLKQQIDIVLIIIILGVVIFGILTKGLITIIYFIAIWLIGGNFIFTPIAKLIARKLL